MKTIEGIDVDSLLVWAGKAQSAIYLAVDSSSVGDDISKHIGLMAKALRAYADRSDDNAREGIL